MYRGTLIAVKDIDKSKDFYRNILNMQVVNDFGANVELEGGLFLQSFETWQSFINGKQVSPGGNAGELYFEFSDIESFYENLQKHRIEYVHGLIEHRWGQRVIRFYDPDGHVIEAAEEMPTVVKRFISTGMNEEQVAERMDVPVDYVRECLKK